MKVSRFYLVSAFSLPLLVALACASGEQGPLFGSIPGSAALRVNIASDEDVQWLEYRVTDGSTRVLLEGGFHPDPWQSISFDFPLSPGDDYTIALTCGTASGVACAGSAAFEVAGGRATEVTVDLVCAPPAPSISAPPAAPCPSVSIATPDTTLPVGEGVELSDSGVTCAATDELTVSCDAAASPASASDGLGSACQTVDAGDGVLHDCDQLGSEALSIQFVARVGESPFACGGAGVGLASGAADIEPRDFRFFVHDVRLIGSDGSEAPVLIEERAPFQALGSALLDFEDATGSCSSGDAGTNTVISGRVRTGVYTGVSFRIGVPDAINHADPALQPAPFGAGTMSWGWLAGYKFLRAEVGSTTGGGAFHLGTTACTGDPAAGAVSCARSNRPLVTLAGFDATEDTIVADLGALFATDTLTSSVSCHSTEAACEPLFAALGLDLQDGSNGGAQSVFHVER